VTNSDAFEFPPDKERIHRRAVMLEWITLAYMVSAIFVIYVVLGSSQAMKTAWVEDILSLFPPTAFLVASRVRRRPRNNEFPYGYHRAVSIAFLVAALSLLIMGVLLFYDSLTVLIAAEHASIGVVQPFGEPVWLGWFMIAALVYTTIPPVLLGRAKMGPARALHDKVLYADAKMNKADWLTAVAAMVGVIGIGAGLWWLDAVAALVISGDIMKDGAVNVRAVVKDLMDTAPTRVDHSGTEALPARIETEMRKFDWVSDVRVRMREEGHIFYGEIYIVPRDERNLVARTEQARTKAENLDWRVGDIVVTFVTDVAKGA
jgi:cation diffusion facilitator family transporter